MSVLPDGTVTDRVTSAVESVILTIAIPGRYRVAIVDRAAGERCRAENPDGLLHACGERFLWVEPYRG